MALDEESCLVGGCLYAALRLSRFHGVAPIDMKPLGNLHVARISNSLVLYSWLFFTGESIAGFAGIIMDVYFYGTNKAIGATNISSLISFLSHVMTMKIIIFFGLYNGRTRMINLVYKVMRCDLTQQFNEKILTTGVICLLVISYLTKFLYFGVYTYSTIEGTIILCLYGFYCIDECTALLLLMQIVCFVVQLQSAFKQINNRLREMMDMQPSMQLNTRRCIRDISISYVQLCGVVRDFNKEYGFMMFVIFTATSSALFINTHHLLITLCLPDLGSEASRLFTTIVISITILSFFTQILILIEPCHRTHEEMDETNVLLNKVTLHLTPIGYPVMGELEIFHMQVKLCKTAFSPLGVYILQRSLIATVISTLVTFIVFIKQYNIIVECK